MKTTLLMLMFVAGLGASVVAKDSIQVQVKPDRGCVYPEPSQEVVVKIDLTAAPSATLKRTPLNVAVVLDRSGSMTGAKIEQAKQAAIGIVDQLDARDIFALVTYDTTVQVLIPAQIIEDKETLRRRIARIQPGGSTALYQGVEIGAAELQRYFSDSRINRVLLLSDGLANVGPNSTQEIATLGRRLAVQGISVSTIGLGEDYNEDLMSALAEASDANYYYVRDVEQLPQIFAKELGQLLTVVARNVRVEVSCPEGIEAIGFIGRPEMFHKGKAVVKFSPFASAQNRYLFLRCRIPEHPENESLTLARVQVNYVDAETGKERTSAVEIVNINVSKDRAKIASSVNHAVTAEKELMLNALAKDEAIREADQGRHIEAGSRLKQQAAKVDSLVASAPVEMQERLRNEARELRQYANELATAPMSKSSRKGLQNGSYQQRNSKSY